METANDNRALSGYQRYMLVLLAMTGCFFNAMPHMCLPVLFKEIADDLDLSLVQIGVVWGMVPLAGLFVILIGGLLADRFGTRRVLIIGCFLSGLAGMSRAFSDSFTTLSATMFLFGIIQVLTAPAQIRACGVWFAGRHLGLANGVLSTSIGFGFLLSSVISATVLSPLLGGWRNVLIAYGILSIGISILWFFSRNDPVHRESHSGSETTASFKESLLSVLHIRNIWVLGVVVMLQVGCVNGMLGYLPTYLKDIGWNPVAADNAVSVFHGCSTLFTVPVVLLSNRLGSRKIVMFVAILMTAVGAGILAFNNGAGVWVAMVIAGIIRDGFMAVQMTMLLEMKGVRIQNAGAAIGLTNTITRIGEIFSPPVGNSLANTNPRYAFLMWAGMSVVSLFGFLFFKKDRETV